MLGRKRTPLLVLAGLTVLGLSLSLQSFAQRPPGQRSRSGSSGQNARPADSQLGAPVLVAGPGALSSQLAAATAQKLLSSGNRADRIRAIRRLGAQNDFAAAQQLVRALQENGSLAEEPAVRIEFIRALAPFASRSIVRAVLISWVAEGESRLRPGTSQSAMANQMAALALSASGDARAQEQLVQLVAAGSLPGQRASQALLAHPPLNLEPLLSDKILSSARVVEFLGELGDMRAVGPLRNVLEHGDLPVRAEAAIALAKMGDEYAMGQARSWLYTAGTTPPMREAAARAFVLLRATDAPRAMAILLADPATRNAGLELALRAPSPQLAPALSGLMPIVPEALRSKALLALARAGSALAVRTLEPMVLKKPMDTDALFALAQCNEPEADALLEKMLASAPTRRMAARAALLRYVQLGTKVDGLPRALEALQNSSVTADQETAGLGLALTHEQSFSSLLRSKSPAIVQSACRAALALGQAERQACADKLQENLDPVSRDAFAAALSNDVSLEHLSTQVLLRWVESGQASSAVLARHLGTRDTELYRPRIRQLLSSGDPVLRSQLALGLVHSPQPSALSLLIEAYAYEPEPLVRRTVIRALSRYASPQAKDLLKQAQWLEPDPQARALARWALTGQRLDQPSIGEGLTWLQLVSNQPSGEGLTQARSVLLVGQHDFAQCTVSDADGWVLVPTVPPGRMRVTVAPASQSSQSPPP